MRSFCSAKAGGELGGSEYLKVVHDLVRGVPPALDLQAERALAGRCSSTLADERLMRSAHDCSDGGLAVTLAECCFDTSGIGAEVSIDGVHVARDARVERGGGALRRIGVARGRFGRARRRDDGAGDGRRRRTCRRGSSGETGGNRLRIAVGGDRRSMCRSTRPSARGRRRSSDYFAKRVA